MITDIQGGKINTVVVYKLDRLSRHQKDVLYLLEDLFEEYHVVFKSVTEPFDTSTPLGRAMIGILAVFGQLERDTIVERTKSGKSERTKQGLWYGGPVPFGYEWCKDEEQLRIIPEQALLVQSAFEQFLQGHSYRAIGNWLSTQTKERQFKNHKTVAYMLSNPIYTGSLQHQGTIISGTHDAIISEDIFLKSQKEQQKRALRPKSRSHHLLSRILFCAICGSPMIHILAVDRRGKSPKKRGYYVCSAKHKKSSLCSSKWHKDKSLESAVTNIVCSITVDTLDNRDNTNNKNIFWEIEGLKKRLAMIERNIQRWYRIFDQGDIYLSNLTEHVQELERAHTVLTRQIEEIQLKEKTKNINTGYLASTKIIGDFWSYLTADEQKNIVHAAIKRIDLGETEQSLSVHWNT